jgi:hypothetical protein
MLEYTTRQVVTLPRAREQRGINLDMSQMAPFYLFSVHRALRALVKGSAPHREYGAIWGAALVCHTAWSFFMFSTSLHHRQNQLQTGVERRLVLAAICQRSTVLST